MKISYSCTRNVKALYKGTTENFSADQRRAATVTLALIPGQPGMRTNAATAK